MDKHKLTKSNFFQNYSVDWTILQNTGMFLGNLVVALLLGLVTSVAWELPLANIQKLVIGSFVSQLSKKTFPKMDSVHFDASRWPSACLCREFIETPLSRPQP